MQFANIMKKIQSSIRAKIISMFVSILFIFIVFSAIYFPRRERNLSLEAANKQVKTLTEMLSFSVGSALSESNFDLVQTAFKWAIEDEQVV